MASQLILLSSATPILLTAGARLVIDKTKRGIQGPAGIIVVIDNLTSTATDKALSANQGRVLNEKIKQFLETFIPTVLGQTVFPLANSVRPNVVSCLKVNGVDYRPGVDYTLSGTTLTWLDNLFVLDSDDTLKLEH